MKEPRTHHLVEFASRYARARFKTLTAGAALWRASALAEDAAMLQELKIETETNKGRFGGRADTYEIISYFSVGLVTCLEWHARSRLVDLLAFKPECIAASDLKNIADLALSQMVAEGATIPHLLGAAKKISHLDEYVSIFDRVFDELGIQLNLERELRNEKTDVGLASLVSDASLYGVIKNLFELRNHLVHEIDLSIIGHYLIRDMWGVDDASQYCNAVVSCLKLVERHITKGAPGNFPNRLGDDGVEEDELEKLSRQIDEVEKAISEKIKENEDAYDVWLQALRASQQSREKELLYLDQAHFLRPTRHFDICRDVQIELLKARLAFLMIIKTECQ